MLRRSIDERLLDVPLFRDLSKRQLARVTHLVTPIDVPAGRELVRRGTIGKEFFVLVEGEVEVRRDGKEVATAGPGEFFGETALLLDEPRNATVVARTDAAIEVIEARDFRQLLEDQPELHLPLLYAAARRLSALENQS
jgi:CRP-like cAMP-binding protein